MFYFLTDSRKVCLKIPMVFQISGHLQSRVEISIEMFSSSLAIQYFFPTFKDTKWEISDN